MIIKKMYTDNDSDSHSDGGRSHFFFFDGFGFVT